MHSKSFWQKRRRSWPVRMVVCLPLAALPLYLLGCGGATSGTDTVEQSASAPAVVPAQPVQPQQPATSVEAETATGIEQAAQRQQPVPAEQTASAPERTERAQASAAQQVDTARRGPKRSTGLTQMGMGGMGMGGMGMGGMGGGLGGGGLGGGGLGGGGLGGGGVAIDPKVKTKADPKLAEKQKQATKKVPASGQFATE